MSTKIYNGYYSYLKLEPLLVKLKIVLNDFKKLKVDEYSKLLVEESLAIIDKKSLTETSFSQIDILSEIYKKHRDSIADAKKTNHRLMEDIDFSASCVLFPCNKKTLILFYSDNKKVQEFWENLDFIHDYHYQDQCDKPDDIPRREWNLRHKNWNKVLGNDGWGIPSENGLTFTFTPMDLPYLHKIMPNLSNYIDENNRANTLLHNNFYDEKYKEIKNQENYLDNIGTFYYEIRDKWNIWKESDDYNKALIEAKEKLIPINFSIKK